MKDTTKAVARKPAKRTPLPSMRKTPTRPPGDVQQPRRPEADEKKKIYIDQPALFRQDRAEHVRKRDPFSKYCEQARKVLEALLDKYENEGVTVLDNPKLLKVTPFNQLGTPFQLVNEFGGRKAFENAVQEVQSTLYEQQPDSA